MEDKDIVDVDKESLGKIDEENKTLLQSKNGDKKNLKKKLIYLFSTIGLSAFFCSFYYCSMMVPNMLFFPIVMFSYMIVLTVLIFVYIIYNRGFSRKGVTEDMLPIEWTYEQKREFIESGERRLQRSKWMLVFIISILFTFIVEAFVLFVF